MPIQIDAKPESGFDEPLGLLSDCHRRIELFLNVLVRIAGLGPALPDGHRTGLENALRYFRDSAPLHTADEEESLFPRLRASGAARRIMDALEHDHGRAAALHISVDRLGRVWLDSGTLSAGDLEQLRTDLRALSDLYSTHIAIEDKQLFPLAESLLPKAEKRVIGGEMNARRAAGVLNSA